MSPRVASQPIQIPEIPPFRKQAHSTMHSPVNQSPQNVSSANASPPRIPEIPPFRPRIKSKEWMPNIEVSRLKVSFEPTDSTVLTRVDALFFLHSLSLSCSWYCSSRIVCFDSFRWLSSSTFDISLNNGNELQPKSTPNTISRSGLVEAPSGRSVWRRQTLQLYTEAPTVL